jgi:hypothetical protein
MAVFTAESLHAEWPYTNLREAITLNAIQTL